MFSYSYIAFYTYCYRTSRSYSFLPFIFLLITAQIRRHIIEMAEKERHSEGYGSQRWIVKEEVRVKAGVILPQALFTPRKLKRITPSLISATAVTTISSPFTTSILSLSTTSTVPTTVPPTLPPTLPLTLPLLISTPVATYDRNSEVEDMSISLQPRPNKVRRVDGDGNIKSSKCDNIVKKCDTTSVNQNVISGLSSPVVDGAADMISTVKLDLVDRSTVSPHVKISVLQSPMKSKSSAISKTPKSSKALSNNIGSSSTKNSNNNNNNINNNNINNFNSKSSSSSNSNLNGMNSSVKNSSLFKFFIPTPAVLSSSQPESEQKKTEIPEVDPKSESPVPIPTQTIVPNEVVNTVEIIILENEDSSK